MTETKLQRIVTHAYNTVKYYKKLFDDSGIIPSSIKSRDDLYKIPLLSKDTIQASPDSFMSSDFLYYPASEEIVIMRTSGSTGKFLKIYWSGKDNITSLYHLWEFRNKYYSVRPNSRLCSFHSRYYLHSRITDMPEIIRSDDGIILSFSMHNLNEKVLCNYYNELIQFKPEWLFICPSTAYILASYISNNNLSIPSSLKYIELAGEYLYDSMREKIEEVFGVPTANMYGCVETGGIAMECSKGHLHCLEESVVVEILKDGKPVQYGIEGDIYLTGLTNKAMPFIRYDIGDRGILCPAEKCSCGNKKPVLKILSGRSNHYIQIEGSQPVSCSVLSNSIEKINGLLGYPIIQYQTVQEDYKAFITTLVVKKQFEGWKDTITQEFLKEMNTIGFGSCKWDIVYTGSILPDPETGKLQSFYSKRQKYDECF